MKSEKSIILIPTLNERENLEKLIPEIFKLMPEISILIVDDNSKDGTRELLDKLKENYGKLFILTRTLNYGYGRASIDGFRWVFERSYDYVITMDADFSHDFNVIPAMLLGLDSADTIIGSRYIKGGGVKNWNLFRKILSKFANFYVKSILGLPVKDATSGFNAYRASSLRRLNFEKIKSDGYAFLVELKYRLFKSGAIFSEYPIIFSERREGESKMSTKIIWESIKLPWKLKFLIQDS